jgi:hypothetical protein
MGGKQIPLRREMTNENKQRQGQRHAVQTLNDPTHRDTTAMNGAPERLVRRSR